ncbi:MAG: diacylglycerol/lipid kinase family protein, partial [Chthoniobacterales bacterium]
MKTCIICNPAAGSVDETDALAAQLARFDGASVQFTKASGDAMRLAREAVANGCETVIAAGGDGTLNEVINGLAEHIDR